jgi:hypothetical protein
MKRVLWSEDVAQCMHERGEERERENGQTETDQEVCERTVVTVAQQYAGT